MLNSAIEKLINQFQQLPGVGEKTAQRFAFFMIKQGAEKQKELAKTLDVLNENLHYCPQCQNFSEGGLCQICQNDKREQSIICVVENIFDILSLEKTSSYSGLYHILHGVLSPIDGIKPSDLKIEELLARIENNPQIKEIIFALSTTIEGETTTNFISKMIPKNIKITHLARGLPTGATLEYADEITLKLALRERH